MNIKKEVVNTEDFHSPNTTSSKTSDQLLHNKRGNFKNTTFNLTNNEKFIRSVDKFLFGEEILTQGQSKGSLKI